MGVLLGIVSLTWFRMVSHNSLLLSESSSCLLKLREMANTRYPPQLVTYQTGWYVTGHSALHGNGDGRSKDFIMFHSRLLKKNRQVTFQCELQITCSICRSEADSADGVDRTNTVATTRWYISSWVNWKWTRHKTMTKSGHWMISRVQLVLFSLLAQIRSVKLVYSCWWAVCAHWTPRPGLPVWFSYLTWCFTPKFNKRHGI